MYENFNIDDDIYLVKIRKNGEVYHEVINGFVKFKGNSSLNIISMKNLEEIIFRDGKLVGRDFDRNEYNIYIKKEDAEFALNNLLKEYSLRQATLKMIECASIKQLEAIYSYMVAEKDREGAV